ncbi:MAG: shikimate kinase [Rickettsiales bacterium]|jgi:shikimate kinase|nr:shikimate kinase [Rickettsiales bacterium]
MNLEKPIVLVGLMGAGKTTIGRELSRRLKIPLVDSDAEIEKAAGLSVADIFELHGEAEFRRLESLVFDRLLDSVPLVKIISAGGGAFVGETVRNNILNKAISIWLKADVDTLVQRTGRRPGKRPLLETADPREILTGLLAKREEFYSKANIHVHTMNDIRSTASKVVGALGNYLTKNH